MKVYRLINSFETKNSQFYFYNENYRIDSVRYHCSGINIRSPSSSSFESSSQKNWTCSSHTVEIRSEKRSHKASGTGSDASADSLGLYHFQPVSFGRLILCIQRIGMDHIIHNKHSSGNCYDSDLD